MRVRPVVRNVQANVQRTVRMASANEPISCYFVANLGNAPAAIVERLERWADASCVEHAVHRHEDGSVALYAVKTSAKTARARMRTLRRHTKEFWRALQTVKLLQVGAKSGMTR